MTLPTQRPATPLAALSTMWAMQPRFEHDLPAFLARARELGFGAIEVNHSMDAEQARTILDAAQAGGLPVTGVHGPAPLRSHPGRGENRDLNLASLDEEERDLAVQDHLASIDLAAEAGAGVVVVHLGHIDLPGGRRLVSEQRLRALHPDREAMPEAWASAVEETREARARLVGAWIEAAHLSLRTLAERAADLGVTLGIETRLNYHEIPLPHEAAELLAPHHPSVVGYLHDVGHAEVQHRLGLTDRSAWWNEVGERLVGLHLHDVRGLLDHRAPGNGDVDFAWLAERVAAANPSAARTFEIDQHEPDEDLAYGRRLLTDLGL